MQNESAVPGNETPRQPSPQLQTVPGYQTTSGQFTAIFTLVAMILGLVGFHYSPAQIESWVQLVNTFLVTVGPFLAVVPVLISYINSRGKIASNTVNANAAILAPQPLPPISGEILELKSGDRLGQIIGGDDWKDPHRYENLLHIAGELGVPGVAQVDKLNQQMHPVDLITGILGMLKNRDKQ